MYGWPTDFFARSGLEYTVAPIGIPSCVDASTELLGTPKPSPDIRD